MTSLGVIIHLIKTLKLRPAISHSAVFAQLYSTLLTGIANIVHLVKAFPQLFSGIYRTIQGKRKTHGKSGETVNRSDTVYRFHSLKITCPISLLEAGPKNTSRDLVLISEVTVSQLFVCTTHYAGY